VPDLTLDVQLAQKSFKSGDMISGRVHFTNTSATDRLYLAIGNRLAVTLFPDGRLAGGFSGALAGLEGVVDLAPQGKTSVVFIGGRTAIDHTDGAQLPAGRYLLVIPLQVYGDGRSDVLITPSVELTLED
jgi:hypothetical protein